MSKNMEGKVIITGASSGLGEFAMSQPEGGT